MPKITAADVARAAGVSLATVDRVLNHRGGVSPDKERRVLDQARRLRLDRALDHRPGRTLRIAVLIQESDNPFHAALRAALRGASDRSAAFNLRFFVHGLDPNDAPRMAARIAACGADHDGLIVCCPAYGEVVAAVRRVSARLPVVTLATDLPPHSGRHAYVGPDDRRAGRVAADLMGRLLGASGGPVLVIAGLLSMSGQRERVSGFEAVLRERYPACRIAAVVESGESARRAGRLAAAFVLDAANGSATARGIYDASVGAEAVAAAVSAAVPPGTASVRTVVITHELTPDRRVLLRAGRLDAVLDQDPDREMAAAVTAIARLLGRDDAPPDTAPAIPDRSPLHIHMRENS